MRGDSTNIGFIEEFVYLAETLSFKRTAEHFFASRSVISRHIASLEESVGVRLLERDSRAVELTAAGRIFQRDAQIILNGWSTALDHARSADDGATTVVRIGYLRNAARPILGAFATWMAEHNPDIQLSLSCMEYTELRHALEESTVDIALGVNVHPSLSRNYRSTRIYEDEFSVICAEGHSLAVRSEGVTLDDLSGEKLLLPDSYVYAGLADLVRDLVDEKSLLTAQAYYRDIDMLFLKVQTEGYLAFSAGMTNSVFGGRMVVLPIIDVDTSFTVSAFYHDGFTGGTFEACRDGFEYCRDELAQR